MGIRNMAFVARSDGEEKKLWKYAHQSSTDQESVMLVRQGWKLIGLQTVSLGNGIGISKIEPLFLNTNDVRCQPVSSLLNYNITAAFLGADNDKDGLLSANEMSAV